MNIRIMKNYRKFIINSLMSLTKSSHNKSHPGGIRRGVIFIILNFTAQKKLLSIVSVVAATAVVSISIVSVWLMVCRVIFRNKAVYLDENVTS